MSTQRTAATPTPKKKKVIKTTTTTTSGPAVAVPIRDNSYQPLRDDSVVAVDKSEVALPWKRMLVCITILMIAGLALGLVNLFNRQTHHTPIN